MRYDASILLGGLHKISGWTACQYAVDAELSAKNLELCALGLAVCLARCVLAVNFAEISLRRGFEQRKPYTSVEPPVPGDTELSNVSLSISMEPLRNSSITFWSMWSAIPTFACARVTAIVYRPFAL